MVSIPLKSGHIVTIYRPVGNDANVYEVSIPLKSGHIVTVIGFIEEVRAKGGFNPLKIGSYCNCIHRKKE